MADIWVGVTLRDKETGAQLGFKEFKVDFSNIDPASWMANPVNWVESILQPQADILVLEEQQRILDARRAELQQRT